MRPLGFYIDEFFQYRRNWYGVLKNEDSDTFFRFVKITHFHSDGYDWVALPSEKETVIKNYYDSR